jgi:CopA family copper-resistance protein
MAHILSGSIAVTLSGNHYAVPPGKKMNRREFLRTGTLLAGSLGWQSLLPAWAQTVRQTARLPGMLAGQAFNLSVDAVRSPVAGREARHIAINGHMPAPLLRWREGDDLTIHVDNRMDEPTSIHWHGLLLPYQMDGVPGVSFTGIPGGNRFTYRFALKQAGTYWYHSHSGYQEQIGHYGPIIIDPAGEDPVSYDREHVIVLSDWTFENPHRVFAKLKKMSDNYNFQQRTLAEFLRDVEAEGLDAALANRLMWGDMRMNPTDLSDVTGATYTYLVNGHSPAENWTGLFNPGEKVRLRFINASAMSIFNIRIPGLPLTVVQADGLDVQPVETDEFQIGTAETFDVVVQPQNNQAYTIMAETNDRSGYGAATLAPRDGMQAPIRPRRPRPTLTMKDMGMSGMEMGGMDMKGMDTRAMNAPMASAVSMDHSAMNHEMDGHEEMHRQHMAEMSSMDDMAMQTHNHPQGPDVMNVAMNPVNRLHERPLGLGNEPHRVLVYTDLKSLAPNPDRRAPQREMELHLTSNMERYMWSFDGEKFSEVKEPIVFHRDERLRLTLVNDTMMPHPIHLHGMFFDVVTGDHHHKPRKHTIVVKPGEKLSVDITADAPGDWAFHCHLLYHMKAGMMRVVSVREGMS